MMLTFAIVEEIFTLKSQNSVHYLRFFRIGTLKNIRLPQTWFVFLGGLLTFFSHSQVYEDPVYETQVHAIVCPK